MQLQYGKAVGVNDLLASLTYDKAKTYTRSYKRADKVWKTAIVERDSILGFVQDKVHINDKWDLTPAIRYSHYGTFDNTSEDGSASSVNNSSSSTITPTINTQYAFDDTMSAYFGWTKVYRPVKAGDLSLQDSKLWNGMKLEDEKGDVWTFGLRKDISDKTSLAVHYDWTNMSNAVTSYSVMTKIVNNVPESEGRYGRNSKKIK